MVIHSARKGRKKIPFLKAFALVGNITAAAKAVRISRDAVHDWRRHDPAFAASFLIAKRAAQTKQETLTLDDALDFFIRALQPYMPAALWPRLRSRMELAVADRNFRVHGGSDSHVSSRSKTVDVSLPSITTEAQATSRQGSDTLHRNF